MLLYIQPHELIANFFYTITPLEYTKYTTPTLAYFYCKVTILRKEVVGFVNLSPPPKKLLISVLHLNEK